MVLEPGQVEFNTSLIEGATLRAAEAGLLAAGEIIADRVRQNINRAGTPRSPSGWSSLRLGRKLLWKTLGSPYQRALAIMKSKRNREAIKSAEAVRDLGGLVDRPGGMPRRREGELYRSIRSDPGETPLSIEVGSNLRYAAIHEYGGKINHPGGTAYTFVNGAIRFISNKVATASGRKYPRTAAHNIVIPARPYLRPSLRQAELPALDAFARVVRESFAVDRGAKP